MANLQQVLARLGAAFGRGVRPTATVDGRPQKIDPIATNEREPRKGPGTGGAGVSVFGEQLTTWAGNRRSALQEIDVLCDNVPEFERALEIISSNIAGGSHVANESMTIAFGPEADETDRRICEEANDRLELAASQRAIARSAVKNGDVFRHLLFSKNGVILRMRRMLPIDTHVNLDQYGQVESYSYAGYKQEDSRLEPFEVAHFARSADEESWPYGRSLFAGGGRIAGHRVIDLADALTYNVLVHCTARNYVFMPRPSDMTEDQIDEWAGRLRDGMKRTLQVDSSGNATRRVVATLQSDDMLIDFPFDAESGRPLGEPKVQPAANAPVREGDAILRSFILRLCVVTGIPPEYFGIHVGGEGLGGAGAKLNVVDLNFLKQMNGDSNQQAKFNVEILRRQLAALGRVLPEGAVRCVMPDLRALDEKIRAEVLWLRAQAAEKLIPLGFPFQFVWVEIIFDGNEKQARESAEKYGVNLDPGAAATATVPLDSKEAAAALNEIFRASMFLREAFRYRAGGTASSEAIR